MMGILGFEVEVEIFATTVRVALNVTGQLDTVRVAPGSTKRVEL